jgi:hypothetical protein
VSASVPPVIVSALFVPVALIVTVESAP